MRLQKFLSHAGVCSRRQGEKRILSGRVRVNRSVVTELGVRVDPDSDIVEIDGKVVKLLTAPTYIAMNKPRGIVTSCDHPGERTVMELIDIPVRVYPVGRLDKDSTGLLLLTNDGRLHHQLSHPSFDHEKSYIVSVAKPISTGSLKKMASGLPLMGGTTRPAKVERVSSRKFKIVLKEGKNRQIRRMVRKVGHKVTELKRIRVSNICIGSLKPGEWRFLSEKEKKGLIRQITRVSVKTGPALHAD